MTPVLAATFIGGTQQLPTQQQISKASQNSRRSVIIVSLHVMQFLYCAVGACLLYNYKFIEASCYCYNWIYIVAHSFHYTFIAQVDYFQVFVNHFDELVEFVTFPLSLAQSLKRADLVSQQQVESILNSKEPQDLVNTRLLKEVRNLLKVSKKHPEQLRKRIITLCQVLSDQDSPTLSVIATDISEKCGTLTMNYIIILSQLCFILHECRCFTRTTHNLIY